MKFISEEQQWETLILKKKGKTVKIATDKQRVNVNILYKVQLALALSHVYKQKIHRKIWGIKMRVLLLLKKDTEWCVLNRGDSERIDTKLYEIYWWKRECKAYIIKKP